MTEEDVKRIIAEHLVPPRHNAEPALVQWLVRAAYEEGWRAGGGDDTHSSHLDEPVGWRLAWLGSSARGVLIRNKLIDGRDVWK